MRQVALGRGGPKVSEVGMGMWQAGGKAWGKDVVDQDCQRAMERAIDLGVNLVDTAEAYGDGHSEEVMGRAIRSVGRENVFVATKVAGEHLRAPDVERACRASLKRLGVREIDLYQVHWPNPWSLTPIPETMKALERLERQGRIRHIGVSNFAVRDLKEARASLSRAEIVSDQVQYSLLHREPEAGLTSYAKREGIALLAWSPIAKGILAGTYTPDRRPGDPIRSDGVLFKPENLRASAPLVALLRRTGKGYGKTAAQVALRWLADQPGVIPIPGAKRAAQAEENAGAADWHLTRTERSALDRASARALGRMDTF
ncbi:MAG TPA: aldo/keto reductase [Thermoplasmata archaeon]|nr:aldo/keto reductase [Thermoplasmata archaeon]